VEYDEAKLYKTAKYRNAQVQLFAYCWSGSTSGPQTDSVAPETVPGEDEDSEDDRKTQKKQKKQQKQQKKRGETQRPGCVGASQSIVYPFLFATWKDTHGQPIVLRPGSRVKFREDRRITDVGTVVRVAVSFGSK